MLNVEHCTGSFRSIGSAYLSLKNTAVSRITHGIDQLSSSVTDVMLVRLKALTTHHVDPTSIPASRPYFQAACSQLH